jgi:transcriptional regulator with XRE-family HTH domain
MLRARQCHPAQGRAGCILEVKLIHFGGVHRGDRPHLPQTSPFLVRGAVTPPVDQKRLADYIGLTVRRLRLDREYTLQALADESGVSKSYLGDIEKGRKNPTTDVIEAIAEALGVQPRRLLYHAALDEADPFLGPEQLTLEADVEADLETREITQLTSRLRPVDRRLLLELMRRLVH